MIFQHTWQQVIDGSKTQTRRIVKPDDVALNYWLNPIQDYWRESDKTIGAVQRNSRVLWNIAKQSYAVQPARGKKQIARIRITDIWREDVRRISLEDAIAEGYPMQLPEDAYNGFFDTWVQMHDKAFWRKYARHNDFYYMMDERPAQYYQAWALTFELVEVYPDRVKELQS